MIDYKVDGQIKTCRFCGRRIKKPKKKFCCYNCMYEYFRKEKKSQTQLNFENSGGKNENLKN